MGSSVLGKGLEKNRVCESDGDGDVETIKMHGEKMRACLGAKKGSEEDMMKARERKQRVTGFLVESPFS